MNKTLSRGLMACLSFIALASCQDYDGGFDEGQIKKAAYAKHFEDTFGTIDPNQDWSMATSVKANVNLPGLTGTAKMNICTGDPRNSETRLLAQIMLKDGKGSIDFDAIKGSNEVFVTVEQDGKYQVFSQYPIYNGSLSIGNPVAAANTRAMVDPKTSFSETCPATLGAKVSDFLPYARTANGNDDWFFVAQCCANDASCSHYNDKIWDTPEKFIEHYYKDAPHVDGWAPFSKGIVPDDAEDFQCQGKTYKTATVSGTKYVYVEFDGETYALPFLNYFTFLSSNTITLQYFQDVETVAADPWSRGQGYSLYGPKGFFEEQQYYYGKNGKTEDKYNTLYGSTEEEKLAMLAKIENGFVITTTGGPIELPFIYGATQIIDQFGYVFYDESKGEDPLAQPHYILMEDGRPDVNLYIDQWYAGADKGAGDGVTGFTGTGMSTWITGLKGKIDSKDSDDCVCDPGKGRWSVAYGLGTTTHADYCGVIHPEWHGGDNSCTAECEKEGTGIYSSTGTHVPGCSAKYQEYLDAYNTLVYGTKYRLMYVNPTTHEISYNFPPGLKIVFFICPVGAVENLATHDGYSKGNFHYSDPELNRRIEHKYGNTASPSYINGTQTSESGAVKACSWVSNGKTYLGFEDGGNDEDLNDIVFWCEGNFSTTGLVELEPIKWHTNVNGVHDETDVDLYNIMNLKAGAAYTQPSGEPKNGDMVFVGRSTTPDNSSDDCSKTISGTTPVGGKCYYAIWALPETPGDYTIKWHKNYDQEHDTSDADLHARQNVNSGAKYSKPATNPTAPAGKVFVGWSTDPNADPSAVISDADLRNVTATGDMCYFAIYANAPTPGPDPEPITWILACEDLGGSFDYDFNDVVWSVKTYLTAGVPTTKVKVLAAGGTLGFTLKYNGTEICSKTDAFTEETTDDQVVNAAWSKGVTRTPKEFTLTTAIENLSSNWTKFSVVVKDHGDTLHEVQNVQSSTLNSKAPQIILLPEQWEWPTELTPINQAYTNFNNWVTDNTAATWTDWSAHKQDGKTVSHQ